MKKLFNEFKRLFCLLIIIGQLTLLVGCPNSVKEIKPQGMMYFSFFDTVSTIYSYAGDDADDFKKNCDEVSVILEEYHKLFDIYNEYSGINNLCTLNKNAGGEPLVVDEKLIEFLLYTKEMYVLTNGKSNVMLGPVLKLWHDARELASTDPSKASIPNIELLQEAAKHSTFDSLEINEENNTIRISDPKASIDVGAIGKGYATEKAAQYLENKKCTSYVLNIGGNIRIIGTKVNGDGWVTGIKNPLDTETYAFYTNLSDTSCVTSGDYERYFTVNNEKYHHIIDPVTLMPSNYFSSITVITKDSGLADTLSTALFCMSYEEGLELVEKLEGVEVLWIYKNGEQVKTDGLLAIENNNN
jgi:thiamine biosynthesis lipoprotein